MSGRRRSGNRADDAGRLVAAERSIEWIKRRLLDASDFKPVWAMTTGAGWDNQAASGWVPRHRLIHDSGGWAMANPLTTPLAFPVYSNIVPPEQGVYEHHLAWDLRLIDGVNADYAYVGSPGDPYWMQISFERGNAAGTEAPHVGLRNIGIYPSEFDFVSGDHSWGGDVTETFWIQGDDPGLSTISIMGTSFKFWTEDWQPLDNGLLLGVFDSSTILEGAPGGGNTRSTTYKVGDFPIGTSY